MWCDLSNTRIRRSSCDYLKKLSLHPCGRRKIVGMVDQILKHAPLRTPIYMSDDLPQVSLVQSFAGRQKEKPFLYVRSEVEQLHNLCHTRSRYMPQTGELCVIVDPFLTYQSLKTNCQSHQARDPGNTCLAF